MISQRPRSFLLASLSAGCVASVAYSQASEVAPPPATTPATATPARDASASAPSKLDVGQPAPAMAITEWIKGSPVERFEPGTIYVVEFWATWCGPCIANIGHLNALQRELGPKGMVVIGVTAADDRNRLPAVKEMVDIRGDGMNYTVAWDGAGTTAKRYLTAAKLSGIPASFVIGRDGIIEFIGHPKALGLVLPKLLDGSWNRERDGNEIKLAVAKEAAVNDLAKAKPIEALAAFKELEARWPAYAEELLMVRADLELRSGDRATSEKTLDEIEERAKRNHDFLTMRGIALRIFGQRAEPGVLDRCLRVLTQAAEISKERDSVTLRLLAKALQARGDVVAAAAAMTKAVDRADGPVKNRLREELAEIEREVEAHIAARRAAEPAKPGEPPAAPATK